MGNMTVIYYKDVFRHQDIMTDCVKRFLKVKKSNSVNVTYITSNKAVTIVWSTMESGFWFLDKIL